MKLGISIGQMYRVVQKHNTEERSDDEKMISVTHVLQDYKGEDKQQYASVHWLYDL